MTCRCWNWLYTHIHYIYHNYLFTILNKPRGSQSQTRTCTPEYLLCTILILCINFLNAKCIYMHAYKTRIICLTIHAVLCVILCWSKSLWICMQVQYWHACNPIVIQMFEHKCGFSVSTFCACVHYNPLASLFQTTYNTNWQKREWTGMIYCTDLGYAFLFLEYWSDALVKWSEIIWIMGFFRRNNYVLIRLQVQEAYIHSVVTDQHIFHAISKSCMNVVTVCVPNAYKHACMYALGIQRVNNWSMRSIRIRFMAVTFLWVVWMDNIII